MPRLDVSMYAVVHKTPVLGKINNSDWQRHANRALSKGCCHAKQKYMTGRRLKLDRFTVITKDGEYLTCTYSAAGVRPIPPE